MPNYQVIMEVIYTETIEVAADDAEEAVELARDDLWLSLGSVAEYADVLDVVELDG